MTKIPEQIRLDSPSPIHGNINPQALSFISEGSEVLSTPIQPRDTTQPQVGDDRTGGAPSKGDTEIQPSIEEPPT